jgi:hypothetical protein
VLTKLRNHLTIKVVTTAELGATVASVSSPRFGWRATTT